MAVLDASGLEKSYKRRKVVDGVDLKVETGEVVGLLGPNGAGKTTTFYMVIGIIRPASGSVRLDNREITDLPMYERARLGIGYLPQEESIFRKLTVQENIRIILEAKGLTRKEQDRELERSLKELGLLKLAQSKAYTLSGGERRRLEITRLLISKPRFILFDEPFTGIDPKVVADIQNIVCDLKNRGIGVLITDHSVREMLEITDRSYIMYEGKILLHGTPKELVNSETVKKLYLGEQFRL
ncbi:MAG: LPS export ABC transporter ATP-binding protein [bacterium]